MNCNGCSFAYCFCLFISVTIIVLEIRVIKLVCQAEENPGISSLYHQFHSKMPLERLT